MLYWVLVCSFINLWSWAIQFFGSIKTMDLVTLHNFIDSQGLLVFSCVYSSYKVTFTVDQIPVVVLLFELCEWSSWMMKHELMFVKLVERFGNLENGWQLYFYFIFQHLFRIWIKSIAYSRVLTKVLSVLHRCFGK